MQVIILFKLFEPRQLLEVTFYIKGLAARAFVYSFYISYLRLLAE